MTNEQSILAVLDAQQAIEEAAQAQAALNISKSKLGQALGELVGSRVTVQGYPATATVYTGINKYTGRQRYVAASVYSVLETAEGRQPRIIKDCTVLTADAGSIEVSVHSAETIPQPMQIVSYSFHLPNILSIIPASIAPLEN